MSQPAIGLIETRGLVSLVEGTDAMLKAANVELSGPVQQVGSALVSACVTGDVADVNVSSTVRTRRDICSCPGRIRSPVVLVPGNGVV